MAKETTLQRFIDAQQEDYANALAEVKNGYKRSHWMWYIFPQIQGLGFSETSKYYAIRDVNEAEQYLKHPDLGSRLIQICNVLLELKSSDPYRVFGSPDDLKLKSSMTLFASLPQTDPIFQAVLDKFFHGAKDNKTLQIIDKQL